MKPELVRHESLIISGYSARTRNVDEMNLEVAKIPSLWGAFATNFGTNAYAVYANYESDVSGSYDITIGVPVPTVDSKPELSSVVIQAGNYLRFRNQGDMPQVVIKTWQIIWQFFEHNTEYQRNYQTDFEVYLDNHALEIFIGVI